MMHEAINPFTPIGSDTIDLLATSMVQGSSALINQLVDMRIERNLSQAEVADLLALSEVEIDEFESRDVSPSLDVMVAYALAVSGHIEMRVSDGEVWARAKRDRLSPISSDLVNRWVDNGIANADRVNTSPRMTAGRFRFANI